MPAASPPATPIALETELFAIERGFWDRGEAHFAAFVDEACLLSFADFAGIRAGTEVAAMARGQVWSEVSIEPKGFIHPVPDFALLTYAIEASHAALGRRRAIVTTGYARRGAGWKAAFHGQALAPSEAGA